MQVSKLVVNGINQVEKRVQLLQDAQKKAKEDQRKADEAAVKQEAASKQSKGKTEKNKEKDEDPDGAQLASVADPLEEASKLLQVLRENHKHDLSTNLLSFEVSRRTLEQTFNLLWSHLHDSKQAIGFRAWNEVQSAT